MRAMLGLLLLTFSTGAVIYGFFIAKEIIWTLGGFIGLRLAVLLCEGQKNNNEGG